MTLLVVLNPHARSGRAGRIRGEIASAFRRHGINVEFAMSRKPGAAVHLAAGLEPGRYDGIVAAGGDGTLFEVVNGLCRVPCSDRPPLGHLPLGTGNAFARDLNLHSFEWERAIQLIAGRQIRPVDIGFVQTAGDSFYFINILGWGFVVDAGLAALRFKALGNAAYTLGVLSALISLNIRPLRIELDDEVIEQENLFVAVSNSRYTGTHFMMAPQARLDDGLLDVTLVRRVSRLRLMRLFPTIFDGSHVTLPEVTTRQVRQVRVREPVDLPTMADGEFRGGTPLEIRCLPGELRLFAPES